MRAILLIICIIILTGCSIDKILHSSKHDNKKLGKIHTRNEKVVSDGCRIWYPFMPIDSTTSTVFVGGNDTSDWTDDYIPGDPTYYVKNDTVYVHDTTIDIRTREIHTHDTVKTKEIITVLDNAAATSNRLLVDSLRGVIQKQGKTISGLQGWRLSLLCVIGALLGISGLLLYLKYRK